MREHGFVEGTNGITYVHKKDERRHRKWCVHYHKDGSCAYMSRCGGSAQCGFYEEEAPASGRIIERPTHAPTEQMKGKKQEAKEDEVKEFTGVQTIKINKIVVPDKFIKRPPSPKKIAELRAYYEKHKKMDKPIYVSVKDGKYYLEDKYLRYYVMKQLGKTWINAIIGSYEESQKADKLCTVGCRVKHKRYGCGTVIGRDAKHLIINFDKRKEVKLELDVCVRNNTLHMI